MIVFYMCHGEMAPINEIPSSFVSLKKHRKEGSSASFVMHLVNTLNSLFLGSLTNSMEC